MHFLANSHRALGLLTMICTAVLIAVAQQTNTSTKPVAAPGQAEFVSNCAGCHGLDGRGGDKAPNIATDRSAQQLSDGQISSIIANGLPDTGMPSFRKLSTDEITATIHYLRFLQGSGIPQKFPGDPARGRQLFFGSAECSSCHTISGEGGFLGPDLTPYASSRPADEVRTELIRTARSPAQGYRHAVVTTVSGHRFDGILRNEDNFSLQLQTRDGNFHFFQKTDVKSLEQDPRSPMPADYGKRLSPGEINDLISFLMSVSPAGERPPHQKEDSDE